MWNRYKERRDEIADSRKGKFVHRVDPPALTDEIADKYPECFEPLDDDINEVYLWHGTSVRAALSIAQHAFRIDLAGSSTGTMYGRGAYCAESSTKADEYAQGNPDGYYK